MEGFADIFPVVNGVASQVAVQIFFNINLMYKNRFDSLANASSDCGFPPGYALNHSKVRRGFSIRGSFLASLTSSLVSDIVLYVIPATSPDLRSKQLICRAKPLPSQHGIRLPL